MAFIAETYNISSDTPCEEGEYSSFYMVPLKDGEPSRPRTLQDVRESEANEETCDIKDYLNCSKHSDSALVTYALSNLSFLDDENDEDFFNHNDPTVKLKVNDYRRSISNMSDLSQLSNPSENPDFHVLISEENNSEIEISDLNSNVCSKGKPGMKRNVSFSSITVHEHSMDMGDNPSVSRGIPVTLGEKVSSSCHDLEAFEAERANNRRDRDTMKLSFSERIDILKQQGYTTKQIMQAASEIEKDRLKNNKSSTSLHSKLKKMFGKR